MSHFFSPLSIRASLVLAFALVLCSAIGLGLFTVQKLDAVSATVAGLRDSQSPAIHALGDASRFSARMRVNPALLADASGTENRIRIINAIKTSADLADKAYHEHLGTITLSAPDIIGEGRGLAATMTNARTAYELLSFNYLDLLDNGTRRAARGVLFARFAGWNGSVSQWVGSRRGLPVAGTTRAGTVLRGAC